MFRSKQPDKKKVTKYITITAQNEILYSGKWHELTFAEDIILSYSIRFFDDPDPCFIHREAVRVRLLAELEKEFPGPDAPNMTEWLAMLARYLGVPAVERAEFSSV